MIALVLATALAATAVTPPPALDTIPARVSVTVADTIGRHVGGALVRIDSTDWRTTTDSGTIVLVGVAPGRHLLEARAIGYAVSSFHVRLDPSDEASVGMTLHRAPAVTLNDVVVQATHDTARAPVITTHDWTEGFAHRKLQNVGGIFIDQEQIERRGAYKMTQLLANLPGVDIRQMRNEFGEYNPYVVMRGTSTADGRKCPISYFLDGHPYAMSDDETVDQLIQPHDVQAIEVYPGASQVPAQFKTATSARCGVIVIWSRSAARSGRVASMCDSGASLSMMGAPRSAVTRRMRGRRAAVSLAFLPVAFAATVESARAQAPTATVPIQYEDARIYVPVRVGAAAARWFILDTGAQPTLLDARVAADARIPFTLSGSTTGAGGRSTRIGFARDVTVTIGPIPLGPQRVTVAPLDSLLGPSSARPNPGIIGSRFFTEHVVEIDVVRSEMRTYNPATFSYRGHGIVVPLDIHDGVPYANGWISQGGSRFSARFLVDLGAKANALVTEHFATKHALAERAPASVTTEFGAGMGGATSYQFIRADEIGLAGDARSRVDSLVVGLSAAGTLTSQRYDALLGAAYLTRFRIILDYTRNRLILEPSAAHTDRDELDMSGLYLIAPDALHRSVVVKSVRPGSAADSAGVRSGDVVTALDELSGGALTVASARERLRSRDGRHVTISVTRDGTPRRLSLTLRRAI